MDVGDENCDQDAWDQNSEPDDSEIQDSDYNFQSDKEHTEDAYPDAETERHQAAIGVEEEVMLKLKGIKFCNEQFALDVFCNEQTVFHQTAIL